MQEWVGKSSTNVLQNIDNNEEKSESFIVKGQSEGFSGKESWKLNNSNHYGQKVISMTNYDASSCGQKYPGDAEVHASLKVDEGTNCAYIDHECSFQKETR